MTQGTQNTDFGPDQTDSKEPSLSETHFHRHETFNWNQISNGLLRNPPVTAYQQYIRVASKKGKTATERLVDSAGGLDLVSMCPTSPHVFPRGHKMGSEAPYN